MIIIKPVVLTTLRETIDNTVKKPRRFVSLRNGNGYGLSEQLLNIFRL
jgi:hypothetical protein